MLRRKSTKDKTEKLPAEEDDSKYLEECPNETTFDEYVCLGNVEIDFPTLCDLLGIKDMPWINIKHPVTTAVDTEDKDTEEGQSQLNTPYKPCLHMELESESPLSVKRMKICGWKVDEQIAKVLVKMLPSLSQLQSLQLWQARLTDQILVSLMSTIPLCSNLRVVAIEGNPLPKQNYHLLLCENSVITQLSLRNNRIGDEGARLIGSALSTARSANKNLLSLNLAFNSIGDAGATYIAQGLRLNRTLLFLSLSNNHIGDSGAAHLAAILGKFALTHEEVVERRRLLVEKAQLSSLRVDSDLSSAAQLSSGPSSTSLSISKGEGRAAKKETTKKDEKPAVNKENLKSVKKTSDVKVSQAKTGRLGVKEKQVSAHENQSNTKVDEQDTEAVEIVNPLLDKSVQREHGQIFLSGNTTLTSLNLSGNKITEKPLSLFVVSLELQGEGEGEGLRRLCLQRNPFSQNCDSYVKIKQLLAFRDPLEVNSAEPTKEEGPRAHS